MQIWYLQKKNPLIQISVESHLHFVNDVRNNQDRLDRYHPTRLAPSKASSLNSICQRVEDRLKTSLANKDYVSLPWDGSNGSVSHVLEMADDMVTFSRTGTR